MSRICFDPHHAETLALLEALDLEPSPERCDFDPYSGTLTVADRGAAIAALAMVIDGRGGGAEILSHDEASRALALVRAHPQKMRALFDPTECPGRGLAAGDIVGNLAGMHTNVMRALLVEYVEEVCPLHQVFSIEELLGIFVPAALVPAEVAARGHSVVHVMEPRNAQLSPVGSAVIVNTPDGNLMTAYHVLFDGRGFREGYSVLVAGKDIALHAAQVVRALPAIDFVLLQVPDLPIQRAIPVATQPPLPGDPLWVVGFPHALYGTRDEIIGDKHERLFTVGRAYGVSESGILKTSARAARGSSGGAILNGALELVGVVSFTFGKMVLTTHPVEWTYGFLPPDHSDPSALGRGSLLSKILQEGNVDLREWLPLYEALDAEVPTLFAPRGNLREMEFLIDVVRHCVDGQRQTDAWLPIYREARAFALHRAPDYFSMDRGPRAEAWSEVQQQLRRLTDPLAPRMTP